MGRALARGGASSLQNPVLQAFFVANGVLFTPAVVEYAIFERVTEDAPSQVYPLVAGQRAVVDLRPAPLGAALGVGQVVALWDVPVDAQVGRYEIHWWYRLDALSALEWELVDTFEVLTYVRARGPQYALVADLRDEGVFDARVPDATLHEKVVRASRLFELYTGRSFEPHYKLVRVNGRQTGALRFEEPIIALESLTVEGGLFVDAPIAEDLARLRIFNRHLSGLTDPDDREAPRIEWTYGDTLWGGRFQRGIQNVLVRGVFGYTDPDPLTLTGVTPDLVRRAVVLLTMRDLPRLTDLAERDDSQRRWRLTGEATKDQSYTALGGVDAATRGALVGGTTGDPEIDNLIILYRKSGQIGAA